jgi:hypothetical protein
MFARRAAVLVLSALAIAACVGPLPLEGRRCPCLDVGWVCCQPTKTCVPEAEPASCSGAIGEPATTDAGLPLADGPVDPDGAADPDAAAAADAAVPGPADPTLARDAAAPEAPAVEPDAAAPDRPAPEPEEPCQAPARGCSADRSATRTCGEQGRWVFEQTCLEGTICSAGDCVCRAGACQDSVLVRSAASIYYIAVGGETLHYRTASSGPDLSGLHRLNLRTGEASTVVADGPDSNVGPLAVDSQGIVTWCREEGAGPVQPGIMRGTELFEPGACGKVAVSDTHVYFTLQDPGGVFRRAVGRPGRERLWEGSPLTFTLAGRYLYLSAYAEGDDVDSIHVHRVSIEGAAPGPAELLATSGNASDSSFYAMAVDGAQVYGADGDGVVRAPLTPGSLFQTFWRGSGAEVKALALSPTHVYWVAETEGIRGCAAATVWRSPKAVGTEAEAVVSYPGGCAARDLLLHGEYLYTVITSELGAQIVRLRR